MLRHQRERIYLIPRWSGLVLAAVVLLIFALGYVSPASRGLTQTLGITLMVAGVVVLIQSNENLRGLQIAGCRSVPVAAEDDAILELTLRNNSAAEHVGIWVGEGIPWRRFWKRNPRQRAWVPLIASETSVTLRLPVPTSRRGRFEVPTLWISSVMPYGLGFAWKVVQPEGSYSVYPTPRGIGLKDIGNGGRFSGTSISEGSADVTGHRPYESGDLLSRIDWRIYARTNRLMIRTLEDGGSNEIILRWHDTDFWDDDEKRLEQLSYWIQECVREDRKFTLDLGPAAGALHYRNIPACHEALAVFDVLRFREASGGAK
ncbi:MAG: DUF58 domain-containing protein [Terrimicrobiaceae bacterium]